MFKQSEKRHHKNKWLMQLINKKLSESLNNFFSGVYPDKKMELLEEGFSENEADEILLEAKQEMQREMIIKARTQFKEKLLAIAKRRQTKKTEEQMLKSDCSFVNEAKSEEASFFKKRERPIEPSKW